MTQYQAFRRAGLTGPLTVADVYRLQEEGVISQDENFELIEGEIVPMAAAKSNGHEQMKQALVRAIARVLPNKLGLFVETSITVSDNTYVEPDICVFEVTHNTQEVRGPDLLLVIEIASSSLGYDLVFKRGIYAAMGVRDYWVVDTGRRIIRAHRNPQGDRYNEIDEYEQTETVPTLLLPEVAIRLASIMR